MSQVLASVGFLWSSKAWWTALRAWVPSDRWTRQLILISLVVIIWMLIPAFARALNIFSATPVCSAIPSPTTETLATASSQVTSVAPTKGSASWTAFWASRSSSLGTVNDTSARDSIPMFWTIISTVIFRSASRLKIS